MTYVVCRITIIETIVEYFDYRHIYNVPAAMDALYDNQEVFCIPLFTNGYYDEEETSDDLIPIEIPEDIWNAHSKVIESGRFVINVTNVFYIPAGSVLEGVSTKPLLAPAIITTPSTEFNFPRRDGGPLGIGPFLSSKRSGTLDPEPMNMKPVMTVLFVLVETADSSTSYDADQIRHHNFASEPGINFMNQYNSCSFGKTQFVLSNYSDGVVEVMVPNLISTYFGGGDVANAAIAQLKAQYGIATINSLADRVVFCAPPGTSGPGWAASAGVRHWRVQANNEWCLSLTGLMHELGHTMGLLHAHGAGNPYGDRTGYMGSGYTNPIWPRKCFNAYNHYQFRWFSDRTLTLSTILLTEKNIVHLAAFVDYDKTKSEKEPVVVAIDDTYYLQYNRAKSFNIDTEQLLDTVTITLSLPGGTESEAGIDVGDVYEVPNYKLSGQSLRFEVCSNYTNNFGTDFMVVSISMIYPGAISSDCAEFLGTTVAPSSRPTTTPSTLPSSTPTLLPTSTPTVAPSVAPSVIPTSDPTEVPSLVPSELPTSAPIQIPTGVPSTIPTIAPTHVSTSNPNGVISTLKPSGNIKTATATATTTNPTGIPGGITTTTIIQSNSVSAATAIDDRGNDNNHVYYDSNETSSFLAQLTDLLAREDAAEANAMDRGDSASSLPSTNQTTVSSLPSVGDRLSP